MIGFALRDGPLDVAAVLAAVDDATHGARVVFEGRVRTHHDGRAVLRLDYEAYTELAVAEGERILAQIRARHPGVSLRCEHRLGRLEIGDLAVLVVAGAAHRDAAFTACREVIDAIKRDVPIWKREHYADGTAAWQHPIP